jgi:plastocyanin
MFVRISTLLILIVCLIGFATFAGSQAVTKQVTIPESDEFIPLALTIHVGDSVTWTNNDEDDHSIVAVQAFTSTDHRTVNHVILGTENNGGKPGVYTLKFNQAGRFLYRCRFHANVNEHHQPIAPGPRGGIQDSKGNFGTPMMGVITVLEQ